MSNFNQKRTVSILRISYLLWALTGMFSIIYIPSTLIDYGDMSATYNNIITNETLFRLGITLRLVVQLFFIIIPLLLYKLFENTNRDQAILMVVLALVSVPITMYNEINQIAILNLSGQEDLIAQSINDYDSITSISMIFWGLWLFPLANLTHESKLFPKVIMILLYLAGIGYLLASLIDILFPQANNLLIYFEVLTMGELLFIIWFVFLGVKRSNKE